MSLDKYSNILGQDTVKKIYEDGLSPAVQEGGKALADVVKGLRLFTAPFQLMGAYQDRLVKYLDKVREGVAEEKQIQAPAFISGPIIEKLKYLEEENYLTDLYLNLLSRAINKERINEAHPAFLHIIDQLSPDEAHILYLTKENDLELHKTSSLDKDRKFVHDLRFISLPGALTVQLNFLQNSLMYIEHLQSLNLVSITMELKEEPVKRKEIYSVGYSEFGKLFINACIPEKGFDFDTSNKRA
jgi:hypothetical protein